MRNWIKHKLTPKEFSIEDGLAYWRERIYYSIILIITLAAIPGYLSGTLLGIKEGYYNISIINTVVYGCLVFLFLKDPFKLKVRIFLLLSLPFIVGIALLIILGPGGAGLMYLIGFSILSAILLGVPGAIAGMAVHLIACGAIALCLHYFALDDWDISLYSTQKWLTVSINSFAVCSVTSLPLSILLKGLEKNISSQNKLQKLLRQKISQLQKAKMKAENADALKTRFLANISHEVRTPLNVIMGLSDVIKDEMYHTDNERKQFLNTIQENGRYLLNLIENILDISMIESKQFKYHIQPCNLREMFDEMELMYQVREKEHIDLQFSHDKAVNASLIHTDETRLKQVLINLINNALKYTYEGRITVSYRFRENNVLFIVQDTGIGIDSENTIHIFDRFTKVNTQNKTNDGTGLGLAIAKNIVEALGGKIWLSSEVNVGSTFYISLPEMKKAAHIELPE
jgi:signal transduction histidine kinase